MSGVAVRKMDMPRALSLLGFKSSRQFETANVESRRKQLDQALFNRMQQVQMHIEIQQEKCNNGGDSEKSIRRKGSTRGGGDRKSSIKRKRQRDLMKADEESGRTNSERFDRHLLQEAYQFLIKKYCPDNRRRGSKSNKKDLDIDDDDKYQNVPMAMF